MVNIGIVGLGRITTEFHIPSLLKIEGVKIKGICARIRTEDRLALAGRIGATFYSDYGEMIALEALDAVYLCSPTDLHRSMAEAAFRKGLHVFCEKPIAIRVQDAEAICAEARKSSRILFIGYNRRFSSTYQKVKQFSVERGINILLLEKIRGSFLRTDKITFDKKARAEIELMGPEILEFGIHFVDLAKWICGKVTKAYFTRSEIKGITAYPGNGVAVFEHEKGVRSIMYLTLAGGRAVERSVAVSDDSTCETCGGMFGKSKVRITTGDQIEEFQSSEEAVEAGGFLQENRNFIEGIVDRRTPTLEEEDILDTLQLGLEWAGLFRPS